MLTFFSAETPEEDRSDERNQQCASISVAEARHALAGGQAVRGQQGRDAEVGWQRWQRVDAAERETQIQEASQAGRERPREAAVRICHLLQ